MAAPASTQKPTHVPGVRYAIDPVDGAELVSIPDAAKITQVSVRTIYNWIYRGQVSVRYRPSGRMQVVAETLFRDPQEPSQDAAHGTAAVNE